MRKLFRLGLCLLLFPVVFWLSMLVLRRPVHDNATAVPSASPAAPPPHWQNAAARARRYKLF